jgi:hypothetical protein
VESNLDHSTSVPTFILLLSFDISQMPSTILAVQKISSESYAAFESRGFNTLMPARLSEVPVSAFPNGI